MATKSRSTKKKDGARSVRHGNVTYSSRPSDNTDCRIRCSPPSRQTFGDGSKQTTVRYRHRTLDIKSPPSGKRKPGVRTGPKTAPAKTAKTAKKTAVKTVPKAPKATETPSKLSALVKELEKEVQKPKAPAKKTPAKKAPAKAPAKKAPAVKKTVSPGAMPNTEIRSWYMAKFPTDDLGKQIRPKLTFAKVWAEMKKGSDYYSMMPGDSVMRERVFDGISDAYKIPYDTVYDTWLNAGKTPAKVKEAILNKAEKEGMNRKELDKHLIVGGIPKAEPKTTAKKPVAKAPAKAPAKPTAPIQSRGVAGKFDAKQLKEIAQFIDKFDPDGRIPIFRQNARFIDYGHVMMVIVSSRIPGKSLVGLPISKTKADIWVPAEKIKERLSNGAKDVQAVEYTGDSFEYTGNGGKLHFLMGNIDVATQAYRDYDDIRPPKIISQLMKKDPEDIVFRTTQSRFATDMKKVIAGCEKGENCAVQVCPGGKYSKYEDNVPMECSTYSANYMKMIANVISKAKNSQCVVIYRPAWPIKVICDFGMYLVEIFLAPAVR